MYCMGSTWSVRGLLVDVFESVLAVGHRDTIGNRTRRHCVLHVDGVLLCLRAVEVAVCDASEMSYLSYGWCW